MEIRCMTFNNIDNDIYLHYEGGTINNNRPKELVDGFLWKLDNHQLEIFDDVEIKSIHFNNNKIDLFLKNDKDLEDIYDYMNKFLKKEKPVYVVNTNFDELNVNQMKEMVVNANFIADSHVHIIDIRQHVEKYNLHEFAGISVNKLSQMKLDEFKPLLNEINKYIDENNIKDKSYALTKFEKNTDNRER